ncbi:hypothetical protein [Bradyrhizobium manausense]|uniref:hypothetical protein n=1 Tax=Bradyrhizobium manausense TaxID=989370 RepID=UPI000A8EC713|nr:hypothetical protein [Bradyrhizobium manausense]
MNFKPVVTLADLDSLNQDLVAEAYISAKRGDPEPGSNRGRAYWHGWRCRMMDLGEISIDDGHRRLVRAYVERLRNKPST